ncbi:hypothetical protein D9O40_02185 [Clostridium autoethanogenum]|uniref:Uncharacterized protein n=1 Tax=Clostridium autoethanogenum TaxID=84023 RepID=A0A3M0T211_9CLOT|nr:hypothetical protein D9O40_02185 [Clostridium autoethanogenum]
MSSPFFFLILNIRYIYSSNSCTTITVIYSLLFVFRIFFFCFFCIFFLSFCFFFQIFIFFIKRYIFRFFFRIIIWICWCWCLHIICRVHAPHICILPSI